MLGYNSLLYNIHMSVSSTVAIEKLNRLYIYWMKPYKIKDSELSHNLSFNYGSTLPTGQPYQEIYY